MNVAAVDRMGKIYEAHIKEGVKTIIGVATLLFDLYAGYKKYRELRERSPDPLPLTGNRCYDRLRKVCDFMGHVSLCTSFATSRPVMRATGFVATRIFSEDQLASAFGSNTTYAINPRHPRHVASIVSFLIGIPQTLLAIYDLYFFCKKKILNARSATDQKIQWTVAFNTLTSRPALHFYNTLYKRTIRYFK